MVEEFNCFLAGVRDGIAYFDAEIDGKKWWCETPYSDLERYGIREGRRFIMRLKDEMHLSFEAIPDKELTDEDYKRIDEELAFLDDWEDDY